MITSLDTSSNAVGIEVGKGLEFVQEEQGSNSDQDQDQQFHCLLHWVGVCMVPTPTLTVNHRSSGAEVSINGIEDVCLVLQSLTFQRGFQTQVISRRVIVLNVAFHLM